MYLHTIVYKLQTEPVKFLKTDLIFSPPTTPVGKLGGNFGQSEIS